MWECKYAEEKVDYKLAAILFIRKIWLIWALTLLVSLLSGGLYYLFKVVIDPSMQYRVIREYYLEYDRDKNETDYTYFNEYTWGDIAGTDYFVETVYKELEEEISLEEVKAYIDLDINSDTRILYAYAITPDEELSYRVSEALNKAVTGFTNEQREIASIKEISGPSQAVDVSRTNPLRAALLGAIFGFVFSLVFVLIVIFTDTSIYIPATLEKRINIPSLLSPKMREFKDNTAYILADKLKPSIIFLEGKPDKEISEEISKVIKREVSVFENPINQSGQIDEIRKSDGVILAVRALKRNSKILERTLEFLSRQDIKLTATVLTDLDEKLIRLYYNETKKG